VPYLTIRGYFEACVVIHDKSITGQYLEYLVAVINQVLQLAQTKERTSEL